MKLSQIEKSLKTHFDSRVKLLSLELSSKVAGVYDNLSLLKEINIQLHFTSPSLKIDKSHPISFSVLMVNSNCNGVFAAAGLPSYSSPGYFIGDCSQ